MSYKEDIQLLSNAGEPLSKEPLEQRIAIAKRLVARLQSQVTLLQFALNKWNGYLALAEELYEAEENLTVAPLNGHVPVSNQVKQSKSINDLFIYFTYQQPNHQTTTIAVGEWSITQGIYDDRKAAIHTANSVLGHRGQIWKRIAPGNYRLTPQGIKRGEQLSKEIDTQLVLPSRPPSSPMPDNPSPMPELEAP